ncbi:MAG: hypothetical protein N3A01_04940 [Bacteroidales bacterium]|nr:hypothetical protein [Bacteroidales bacterium]
MFFLLFLISCNTDVNVQDNWRDITVVYGILDPADTIQIVRVSKAFLGAGNAYEMAKIPDSFYYSKPVNVFLEEWNGTSLTKVITLVKDSIIHRDEGVFSNSKNYYFVTKEPLNMFAKYKLKVNIENKTVEAETYLIPGNELYIKNQTTSSIIPQQNSYIKVVFKTPKYGKIFQTFLRFYYYEVFPDDTVKKHLDIYLSKNITATIEGNEEITVSYPSISFYETLKNKIKNNNANLLYRVVAKKATQIIIYVGSQEYFAYLQSIEPVSGVVVDKPLYNNISNGIGLFTSRFTKYSKIDSLNQRTVDSIANSQYTKHLKFLDFYHSNWNNFP